MKAILLGFHDGDPGPGANDVILKAQFLFVGQDVPNGPIVGAGADGSGVNLPSINVSTVTPTSYSNAVEDGAIAEATRLGLPTLARTDVLLINYVRGT